MPMRCLSPPLKAWGVATHVFGAQTDTGEQGGYAVFQLLAGGDIVDFEGVADDIDYGHAGVEGVERILEDHAYLLAVRLHFIVGEGPQVDHFAVMVLEEDLAAGEVIGAQDAAAGGRLAAAALADEAHSLTLQDIEGDIIDGLDVTDCAAEKAGCDWKPFLQVSDIQKDVAGGSAAVL